MPKAITILLIVKSAINCLRISSVTSAITLRKRVTKSIPKE